MTSVSEGDRCAGYIANVIPTFCLGDGSTRDRGGPVSTGRIYWKKSCLVAEKRKASREETVGLAQSVVVCARSAFAVASGSCFGRCVS